MVMNTVYTNGKIVTVDKDFTIADAFAVSGDTIAAVGANVELAGARIVDLGGRLVLPGFVDAHPHSVHLGADDAAEPSLAGLTSVAAIAERIGEAAARAEPGAWIVTSPAGVPPDYVTVPDGLTRAELDAVAPHNPVYIPTPAHWPHPAILNSEALALLGITRDTPDADGVRIVRDAAGEPTGVIHGLIFYNARSRLFGRLMSLLPPMSDQAVRDGIAHRLAENVAAGLTTLYEGHGGSAATTAHLRALRDAGRLVCRVVGTYEVPVGRPGVDVSDWLSSVTDEGDDLLRIAGVTISLDGPAQFGLSMMNEPYLDPHGEPGRGSSVLSTEDLADLARLAVRHDLRLNVLASGDVACGIAVDALEAVHRETPLTGRQWVVQHFHHVTKDQITRLAAMGMVAQICAGVDYARGEFYTTRLPGDLWERVTPLRWWLDAGVPVALASDGAHSDPLFQLWAALTRVDARSGRSLLTPAKTITREEAIRAHTAGGATVLGQADRIGSIEAGKLADFVVLDRDILTCPDDEIREARVLTTVLGGEVVHEV
jgi:predicted amidohydrolase YtcJ